MKLFKKLEISFKELEKSFNQRLSNDKIIITIRKILEKLKEIAETPTTTSIPWVERNPEELLRKQIARNAATKGAVRIQGRIHDEAIARGNNIYQPFESSQANRDESNRSAQAKLEAWRRKPNVAANGGKRYTRKKGSRRRKNISRRFRKSQ